MVGRVQDTRENALVRLLPILLVVRVFVDGFYNFKIHGSTATNLMGIIIFAITVFLFLTRYNHGAPILFLLSAVLTISCFSAISSWGNLGWNELIRTIGIFGIFLIAANSKKNESILRFFRGLRLISALCGADTILQMLQHKGGVFVSGGWRYPGLMYSPNTAAILFSSYLMAEYCILRNSKDRVRILSILLSAVGLLFTLSFGGFVFLAVGIFVLLAFQIGKGKFQRLLVSGLLVIFSVIGSYLLVPAFRAKINLSLLPVYAQNANASSSLQWRFDAWNALVQFWIKKPIFGQGFGSTRNLDMAGPFMPHDEYLRILIEIGAIGIIIFISCYLILAAKIVKFYRLSNDKIALYTFALMTALAVNAITENTFTYTVPDYILAASLGFTIATKSHTTFNSSSSVSPYRRSDEPAIKNPVT